MSSRSNEERLHQSSGAPEVPTPPAPPHSNNNLSFITPTEFVELPTLGAYYMPDHPLYNKKVVEVKHMTTKEEDILTSTTLLKNGVAIEKLLESIIVDKNIKVDDLLLGDKNALIVAARSHGYGSLYETSLACPRCEEIQQYEFDLSSLGIKRPSEDYMAEKDIQISERNTFLIPLPKTEYTVEVRLLTGHDEKKMSQTSEHKKKRNLPETPMSDFLRAMVVSVNGIEDPSSVNGFLNSLPALHGRYLRKVYDNLVPSLDLEHDFNCASCSHEGTLEVPLTTDFFWPVS